MSNNQQVSFNIPTSPDDKKKIREVLRTISDSFYRIEAEKDLIKEQVAGIAEKYELPKKLVNKMARTFHKQNFQTVNGEADDFATLYENVVELPQD